MWNGKKSIYQEKFQDSMGFFFDEKTFPLLSLNKDDVSGVLQEAINKLVDEQGYGILYIPEGEYPLKSTVKIPPSVRLIGYGKTRPVFVLPANTEGFDSLPVPETEREDRKFMSLYPMLWFIGNKDTNVQGEPKDADSATFYSAISNIDFRIEEGNPYAICIRAHFAQHGFISHCHFDLGDALAAIFDVGNEMEDLTFEGGQYGIVCRMCSPGWPFALLDSVFNGQKKAAIVTMTTGFTGFRLRISNTPRAFTLLMPRVWEKLYLEDCVFENIAEAAITFYQTDSVIQQTNIRHSYCENVPVFVEKEEDKCIVKGPGRVYEVKEYTYGYVFGDDVSGDAKIQEIFDVNLRDELPQISKGDIPPMPAMDQWVSVEKYGAVGDGVTDDTAAIQKAVAAEAILYFPQGIYKVSDTILLKRDVTLIGMSPITTQIIIEDDTPAFAGFGSPKAVLETAVGGYVYMNGIGIDTAGKNPRAVGIKWMAGETSYMNDVKFVGGHGLMFRDGRDAYSYLYNATRTADYDPDRRWDYQYSSLWITSGGGGVFKDIWSASPYAEAGICITDTETPGKMYAISLEHHVRSEMKMYRVKNWKFYAIQTEEERAEGLKCLPMELVSCENILFANFYLFRVIAVDRSDDIGIKLWDCKNIEFLNVHNKAQMQYIFTLTAKDETTGFYAKSPEYAKLLLTGYQQKKEMQKVLSEYEMIAEGFDFAQGAIIDKEDRLYWCDRANRRIYQYDPKKKQTLPFLDIHFIPSALAVDTTGHLLVTVDYSELKNVDPAISDYANDTRDFHPFYSWFDKRSERVYAVEIKNPFNTIMELKKTSAKTQNLQSVYRPAQLSYYGPITEVVELPVKEYYVAPDGVTALEGTIDLARSLILREAKVGTLFYMTDDPTREVFSFVVTEGGNLKEGFCCGNRGQYGAYMDENHILWTLDDKLYGFQDKKIVACREVPWDAYTIIGKNGRCYLLGRGHVYCDMKEIN